MRRPGEALTTALARPHAAALHFLIGVPFFGAAADSSVTCLPACLNFADSSFFGSIFSAAGELRALALAERSRGCTAALRVRSYGALVKKKRIVRRAVAGHGRGQEERGGDGQPRAEERASSGRRGEAYEAGRGAVVARRAPVVQEAWAPAET